MSDRHPRPVSRPVTAAWPTTARSRIYPGVRQILSLIGCLCPTQTGHSRQDRLRQPWCANRALRSRHCPTPLRNRHICSYRSCPSTPKVPGRLTRSTAATLEWQRRSHGKGGVCQHSSPLFHTARTSAGSEVFACSLGGLSQTCSISVQPRLCRDQRGGVARWASR